MSYSDPFLDETRLEFAVRVLRVSLPVVVSIVIVLYSGVSIWSTKQKDLEARRAQNDQLIQAERSLSTYRDLQHRVEELSALVEQNKITLGSAPTDVNSVGKTEKSVLPEITTLRSEVAELRNEIKSFETALGDDPAKKMTVVILRRDVDNLVDSDKAQNTDLRREIASSREDAKNNLETVKWLLGAIGISNIVAPLAGALLQRKSDLAKP